MGLHSLLSERFSDFSLERLASSKGIGPFNSLLEMSIVFRRERLPSIDGMSPVNSFLSRNSSFRKESLPSSEGIEPLSLLPPKDQLCKAGETA